MSNRKTAISPQGEATPAGQTVLIVEDDETVLIVASRMLELAGYTVLTATKGQTALTLFKRQSDSIARVLLDLTLADMDGKDVFLAMLKIQPHMRIVLTSGYDRHEALAHFPNRKPAAFVQKPFTAADLIHAIAG